ncbi:MAG TPA: AMIN domain-containing protein, partial [Bryobacteraceae bacterium]|nr:AMIN domain-containing protein [Bryobacteraceae bacterium]
MKLMAAFAVAIPLLLAETGQSAAHRVTGIREWSFADTTRVVVEVSGDFEIRTDRLHNPERVYFDILNSRPTLAARRSVPRDTGDRLVKRIRLAETVPGVSRVVLDLADGVEVTTSQLTNPNRLIIELRMGAAPAIPAVPAVPAPVPAAPPFVLPTSVGPSPAPAAAVKIAVLPAEAPPVLASPGPAQAPAVVTDAVKIQPVKAAAPALAGKVAAPPVAAPPPDLAEVPKSAR